MSYNDKQITCSDCGTAFIFSAGEQESFASRGYTNEPKRCPACRAAKKQNVSGSSSFGNSGSGSRNYVSAPRQMFPVKCSTCGKDTEVPFEPRSGRPVYCSDCYRKTNPVKRYQLFAVNNRLGKAIQLDSLPNLLGFYVICPFSSCGPDLVTILSRILLARIGLFLTQEVNNATIN